MGYREHTAEFLEAVRGERGELDAWLECNNEAECRAAILGAIEEERERCAKHLKDAADRIAPDGKRTNQYDKHMADVLRDKADEIMRANAEFSGRPKAGPLE